jgi:hypothetical protein
MYAASWRTSEVHPAFDQSFASGGSALPMNSSIWFSSFVGGFSGRAMYASIASLASGETARRRRIQRMNEANEFAVARLRFGR